MKLVMDERLKHRLVGIVVILSIAAIFAPAILKKSSQRPDEKMSISITLPPKPEMSNVMVPAEQERLKKAKIAQVVISPDDESTQPAASTLSTEPLAHLNDVTTTSVIALKESAIRAKKTNSLMLPVAKVAAEGPVKNKKAGNAHAINSSASLTEYVVQLGIFSQQRNATSLVEKLKKKGYIASYNKIAGKNGAVFKVIVGRVKQKSQALRLQQQLATETQLHGVIVATGIG